MIKLMSIVGEAQHVIGVIDIFCNLEEEYDFKVNLGKDKHSGTREFGIRFGMEVTKETMNAILKSLVERRANGYIKWCQIYFKIDGSDRIKYVDRIHKMTYLE